MAGTLVGNRIKCEQAQHVIGDVKHYAVNDQESGRTAVNVIIGERAMHETDLLAFQLAIAPATPRRSCVPTTVSTESTACQNQSTCSPTSSAPTGDIKGFVVSDWGGTHSTVEASHAGLDQEQPNQYFYGAAYKQAVEAGTIPQSELDEHVRHILYADSPAE